MPRAGALSNCKFWSAEDSEAPGGRCTQPKLNADRLEPRYLLAVHDWLLKGAAQNIACWAFQQRGVASSGRGSVVGADVRTGRRPERGTT